MKITENDLIIINIIVIFSFFFYAHGLSTIHYTSWPQHDHPVHWHDSNINRDVFKIEVRGGT